VVAAAIGAGLGGLWLWNGNLLLPIVAHATYDFVALICLARIRPQPAPR
jgi:membrane protease YdiL (CAAX protease family)